MLVKLQAECRELTRQRVKLMSGERDEFLEELTLELGLEAWVEFHLEKAGKGI